MEKYIILEIYHLPSGNDMASAVMARCDNVNEKFNTLLQLNTASNEEEKQVTVFKYNKECNKIEAILNCYAADHSELPQWKKDTIIIHKP